MDKLKKNYIFLLTITIVGVIVGIIFSNILSVDDEKLVFDKLTNYFSNIKNGGKIDYLHNFFDSIKENNLYIIIVWLLGLSIIGIICNAFILFFKSFVLGFSIGSIINIYLYKGIILALAYIFPHMLINIVVLAFLVYKANNFSIKLIKLLFMKKDIKFNDSMHKYLHVLLFVIIITLGSSIIETFLSPFLIKLFTFLIN